LECQYQYYHDNLGHLDGDHFYLMKALDSETVEDDEYDMEHEVDTPEAQVAKAIFDYVAAGEEGISWSEYMEALDAAAHTAWGTFEAMDGNGDGLIDHEELEAAEIFMEAVMQRVDTNEDGMVDALEAMTFGMAVGEWAKAAFASADDNGDMLVTAEEFGKWQSEHVVAEALHEGIGSFF